MHNTIRGHNNKHKKTSQTHKWGKTKYNKHNSDTNNNKTKQNTNTKPQTTQQQTKTKT